MRERLTADRYETADKAWMAHAACARIVDADGITLTAAERTALFHPERGDMASVAAARVICAGCPVTGPCFEFAVVLGVSAVGVWGGTSERQRRARRARTEGDAA